jgi:predicted transcriptional regulator of viral defense system
MNFETFRQSFYDSNIFSTNDVLKRFKDFDTHRLTEWQKKDYIFKIINRFYSWKRRDFDREEIGQIANRIYTPSYISLKSALRYYNFIPEGVFQSFSVTTRKTAVFETPVGFFNYKNIKENLFFGFYPMPKNQGGYLMAEPEKAILDFFYLYTFYKDELDIDGLRFNYDEINDFCTIEKFQNYAKIFSNKRVTNLTNILIEKLQEND